MIIIVAGLPGSGKSYLASRLAVRLGARYINSDRIRKDMDRMGRYTFEDKWIVYQRMAELTAEASQQGDDVVIDATFYLKAFRKLFAELAQHHHSSIYQIEVVADEAIVKERLRKPRKLSEADYQVHLQIKGQFERFEDPHLILQSKNIPVDHNMDLALDYIKGVHEGSRDKDTGGVWIF